MTTTRGILTLSTAILLLVTLGCGGATQEPATDAAATDVPATPHPVIVVAIDGLRADHVRCASGGPSDTPHLDALASESACFEQAFTQSPDLFPALASLLTGTYPTTHSLDEAGDVLPLEAETVAEAASAAGVPTAAFLLGEAGGAAAGLDQGFGTFELGPTPVVGALDWIRNRADAPFMVLLAGWSAARLDPPEDGPQQPEGFSQRVQEVLASRGGDDPKLLEEADLEYARTAARAHLARIDATLGELRASLAELGLDERATLVVTGTAGFAMQEHDDLLQESLYPAVVRVPLLIRLPGGALAGPVSKVVEVLDLAPTVADLLAVEPPAAMQASSLLPLTAGGGTPPYVAFGERAGRRFVAMGGYQMVADADGANPELFHLTADPLGLEDLAAEEPGRVEVLQEHLEAWDAMVHAASLDPEKRTEELDDATLEQLKSLGYIQ